jgi:hypothetical protein
MDEKNTKINLFIFCADRRIIAFKKKIFLNELLEST